jgi:hypothetical protein
LERDDSRLRRVRAAWSGRAIFNLVVVVMILAACDSKPNPSPTVPPSQSEATPTSQPGEATAVKTVPCAATAVTTTAPQPYLDKPAEPPVIPGAGGPEDEDLNDGQNPTTPIDPDAPLDTDSGAPSAITPPNAQGEQLPTDVITFREPTTFTKTSQIAEPNIAVHGNSQLMTWNWGAARSFDGGTTSRFMDPYHHMFGPDGTVVDGGYCCDQLAQYIPALDLWVWVLQSRTLEAEHRGGNRIRLFMAKGENGFDRYWDFRSQDLDLGADTWFDQPKIGMTAGNLFISVNAFGPNPPKVPGQPDKPAPFRTAVVARLPVEELSTGDHVAPTCFTTNDQPNSWGRPMFGLVPARTASSTMYLGAHYSNSTLAVWRWPDGSSQPTLHLALDTGPDGGPAGYPVPIKRDAAGSPVLDAFGNQVADVYRCLTDGVTVATANWCERSTDRISTAWTAGGQIGFAWNVGQDPGHGWNYPSVWVEILDSAKIDSCLLGGCVIAKPHVRNQNIAFQHAAIGPNSRGDLGIALIYGGGAYRETCGVGVRDAATPAGSAWDLAMLLASDTEPVAATSGDYLNVWPGSTDGSWAAGCMTVQKDNGTEDPGSVHFAWFGRRSDQPTP